MPIGTYLRQIPSSTTTVSSKADRLGPIAANDAALMPQSPTSVPVQQDTRAPLASRTAEIPSPIERRAATLKSFEEYIPRPHLTVAPTAVTPVNLEPPSGEKVDVRRVGVLLLYIDETGTVQDVIAKEPLLPEAYEKAARDAFMTVKFLPGEFAGRSVKSNLRVEVIFEETTKAR